MPELFESSADLSAALAGRRFISAELMYTPRPEAGRAQVVFDAALASRLSGLDARDAVVFVCDSAATMDSLAPIAERFPGLTQTAIITNPTRWTGDTPDTPRRLNWEQPDVWRRYTMTDRWARISMALAIGAAQESAGCLVMPAHDAIWGRDLLARLVGFSERHAKGGLPAAVSPYTPHQHSSVEGADIPHDVIDLLNVAFGRDALFAWKLRRDMVQAFWGKMGMIPFGMCAALLERAERGVWEDDLEIDRLIREAGWGVRTLWVNDPLVYRQALPVFDEAGARRVIERTLHYSLNIPGAAFGSSALTFPLGLVGQARQLVSPRFREMNARAEALIASCTAEVGERLARYGASWVDWGAYRHVMRVGDPFVEVWRKEQD